MNKFFFILIALMLTTIDIASQETKLLWGLKFDTEQQDVTSFLRKEYGLIGKDVSENEIEYRKCSVGGIDEAVVSLFFKKDKLKEINVSFRKPLVLRGEIMERLRERLNSKYGSAEENHYMLDIYYDGDGYGIEEIKELKMQNTAFANTLNINTRELSDGKISLMEIPALVYDDEAHIIITYSIK